MDHEILERVSRAITRQFGFQCQIAGNLGIPSYAYNLTRKQYNSILILKNLVENCPEDLIRILGITEVDLYIPILKFVHGTAQMEGKCAVLSLCRLRPENYGGPVDKQVLLSRVEKTAIHELGHTFGLTHCKEAKCAMYYSSHINDTDFKSASFCVTCNDLLKWKLERSGMLPKSEVEDVHRNYLPDGDMQVVFIHMVNTSAMCLNFLQFTKKLFGIN